MSDSDLLSSIDMQLKVIVNLLLQQPLGEGRSRSLRDQIQILHGAGFKPNQIAKILGKSNVHINKELTMLRKSGKVNRKS